ncbi:hypothetical protein O0L34_g13143 [Tuta absoluta]|nr:hypothetical protein O0L34_g13143 [Tuta absoluta]
MSLESYPEKKEAVDSQVEFIKHVERHVCLYNNLSKYSNKSESQRAWREIAEAINSSEHECKDRWRRLRTAFVRSLRQAKTSHLNRSPYYLHKYLTFLIPYCTKLKDYEETAASVSPACSDEEEDNEPILAPAKKPKVESVEAESDPDDDDDDEKDETESAHEVYIDESYKKPKKNRKRKKSLNEGEISARKMFLLSLIPDIESLTDDEMRAFRMTVISCIDGIISSRKK